MKPISNYINGELVAPNSGNYIEFYDSSTGQIYSKVPDLDASDVAKAVKAANFLI